MNQKYYFDLMNHKQWITDELEWNCSCQHGSYGRFAKGHKAPCIHIVNVLYKWSKYKIEQRIKEKINAEEKGISQELQTV